MSSSEHARNHARLYDFQLRYLLGLYQPRYGYKPYIQAFKIAMAAAAMLVVLVLLFAFHLLRACMHAKKTRFDILLRVAFLVSFGMVKILIIAGFCCCLGRTSGCGTHDHGA